MKRRWRHFLHLLELARLQLVLSSVGNSWLMVFLAFALEPPARRNPALSQLGLPLSLALAALVAAALTTFAMTLNDVLDVHHDRTFYPGRPLPTGAMRPRAALVAAGGALVVAIAAAVPLGEASAVLTALAVLGIVFYNLVGRFVPAAGVITLAVVYALNMLIPNPRLSFAWPLGLAVTHVFACATIRRAMPGSRPRMRQTDAMLIAVAWLFISLMIVSLMNSRHGAVLAGAPRWMWTGPLAAIVVFAYLAARLLRAPRSRTRAGAQRFAQLADLWLMVYAAVWLLAAECFWQGGVLLVLLLVALTFRPALVRLRHRRGRRPLTYRLDIDRPIHSHTGQL